MMQKTAKQNSLLGVAFAFSKEKLADAAEQRGCHHIDNLSIRAI